MRQTALVVGGGIVRTVEHLMATFHGLGRELLERYGRVIGVPRFFSVYDRDDSEKLIATALKALDVDAKELSPRSVLFRISKAKGEGMTVTEFAERQGRSSFAARVTDAVAACARRLAGG